MRYCHAIAVGVLAFGFTSSLGADPSQEPLHVKIDHLVAQSNGEITPPLATDAEFLRRLHLDLLGVPPTAEELRAFLADPSIDKRSRAVDRCFEHHRYPHHIAGVLDVMLMERRPNQQVSADQWTAYLVTAVRDNKPLHALASEILSADGVDPQKRPAARFYLDRGGEPNLLTRDVGRIFFGRDFQCAQCHDHALIDDYHQADYQGLYAFFEPGVIVTVMEGEKKDQPKTFYGERSGSEIQFESVFIKGKKHLTRPRVPGFAELVEPIYAPGEDYAVRPADGVPPVPKYSRRAQLAAIVGSGNSQAFNENWANRLWAHMMGRGLVHPVDLHHSSNPPANADLLALLGRELAAMKFDLKAFLRELAMTSVYQRALDLPVDVDQQVARATEVLAQLESSRPPLAKRLEETQAAFEAAVAERQTAEDAYLAAFGEIAASRTKVADADKAVLEALKVVNESQSAAAQKQEVLAAVTEAASKAAEAAKKLPDDKDFAAAAAKLNEKMAPLQADVTQAQTVVQEKTTAHGAATAAYGAAKTEFDAVIAKVAPLHEALHQREVQMIETRAQFTSASTALNYHDSRIETAQQLVAMKTKSDELAASQRELSPVVQAVETTRGKVVEQALLLAQKQAELEKSRQEKVQADAALAEATAEKTRREEVARIVSQAFTAVQVAQKELPDDARLASIAGLLKGPLDQSSGEMSDMNTQMGTTTAAVAAAGEKIAGTQQAIESALVENQKLALGMQTTQQEERATLAKLESEKSEFEEEKSKLVDRWTSSFLLASLKPLSPEQLCWSLLRVTQIDERYHAQEQAELDKSSPMPDEAKNNPEMMSARIREIQQRAYDKLKGNVNAFVTFYAAGAGQPQGDFFATADQALFAANGGTVNAWVAPAGGNVTERVAKAEDTGKAAEDLYMTVLSRPPTIQEAEEVSKYLAPRSADRFAAAQELVWALVTSAEFRFNH